MTPGGASGTTDGSPRATARAHGGARGSLGAAHARRVGPAGDDAGAGGSCALASARRARAALAPTLERRGDRGVAGGARSRRGPRRARSRHRADRADGTGSARAAYQTSSPPIAPVRARRATRRGGRAREADDFAAFAPALERNVQLARAYGECLVEEGGSIYEALLADYDFGLRTQQLRALFSELAERLPPLAQDAREHTPRRSLQVPVAAQQAAVAGVLRRIGVEDSSWRVDVSAHPFSTAMALRRQPRDHALQRRRRGVAPELAARVRPCAVRAPGRARARAHEPRHGHLDVGARVPEQAVGEPRRAQPRVRARARRGAAGRAGSRGARRALTTYSWAWSPR